MVRALKHHEKKLLKKVDFLDWKQDQGHRDTQVMRTYHIQNREDYHKYNKICGDIRKLAHKLSLLQPTDPFRIKHEQLLLEKLYNMGVLSTKSKISDLENKVTVSSLCRRRTGCWAKCITDPAYLITRNLEDYLTWVDNSKIKRNVLKYKNKIDDFDLA
ncbi:Ribosomal protein S4/S9 N-terminal domain family protein [Candida albicans]|uniref:Ribosomal protein S4/S9 N-terminal domain family protein n=1 Tax=Candida albicans TaxID=5476 RepID=A0A8H6C414_CANAX|nr:Ribosomal protein S4/S9 N-terminal domain family protein [Candida albicans]